MRAVGYLRIGTFVWGILGFLPFARLLEWVLCCNVARPLLLRLGMYFECLLDIELRIANKGIGVSCGL